MKQGRRIALITLIAFLLGGALWLCGRRGSEGDSPVADRQAGPKAKARQTGEDSEALASRMGKRRFSHNVELKRIDPGEESDHEELWVGNKFLFKASRISTWSELPNGSWIISAITGDKPSEGEADPIIGPDGNLHLDYSPIDLWLVKDGQVSKVNPEEMDAGPSVASPDGKKIAFSGCYRDPQGLKHVIPSIYVMDLETRKMTPLTDGNDLNLKGDYEPVPERWGDDGKTLEIMDTYGEMGIRRQPRILSVP